MSDLAQDPRRAPRAEDDLALDDIDARPMVGRRSNSMSTVAIVAIAAVAGVAVFAVMNARRTALDEPPITQPIANAPQVAAPPPPMELPPTAPPLAGPLFQIPGPQFTTNNAIPIPPSPAPPPPMATGTPSLNPADPAQRRRAPALVVDLGAGEAAGAAAIPNPALTQSNAVRPAGTPAAGAGAAGGDAAAALQLSAEERFAERIGAGESAAKARATTLRNLDSLVPQGAVIPAVLETAVNSDLPGFTRAVVSRDVKSFDGSQVLIPRGSRLIGQYKSGVALGASRLFVIWTRVIRPDGVAIDIASPGTDTLGQGGLEGKVDRKFFQRFGGSILLSVVNAGMMALANAGRDGSQIYIGSPVDAANVATAAFQKDGGVPPTIKTPQGAPVSIFVARDLDFTGVAKLK
jgi:type IV secretion system protein VirB10